MSEIAEYRTPRVPIPSTESSLGARLLLTVLSIIAGSVDAIGFLGLGGLFTAHVTGNLVILAAHLVSDSGAPVAPLLSVPVFVATLGLTRLLAGALGRIGSSLRPSFFCSSCCSSASSSCAFLPAPGSNPTRRSRSLRACSASRRWPCRTHLYRYR